jgi:hypothetical protein
MLDIPHTTQKLQNFFRTGDNWQLLGFLWRWNDFCKAPILMKRDSVEKTKRRYGNVDRAWGELPFVCQVDLVGADLLGAQ